MSWRRVSRCAVSSFGCGWPLSLALRRLKPGCVSPWNFGSRPRTSRATPQLFSQKTTRARQQERLDRELRHLGVDPSVLSDDHSLHKCVSSEMSSVVAFLEPHASEAAVAMLPGRASLVAAGVADAIREHHGFPGLRNDDQHQVVRRDRHPLVLVLHDVGAHEVGCLLRTCDAAGIQEVFLCGNTPGTSAT